MERQEVLGAAPTAEVIEAYALGVIARLPAAFRQHLGDVVLLVEEEADAEMLASVGLDHPLDLTGVYVGRPVGEKSSLDSGAWKTQPATRSSAHTTIAAIMPRPGRFSQIGWSRSMCEKVRSRQPWIDRSTTLHKVRCALSIAPNNEAGARGTRRRPYVNAGSNSAANMTTI